MKMDKVGVVGIGQCGNKFAAEFAKAGVPCLAINTTSADMSRLNTIKKRCLIPATGFPAGAGKDPRVGERAVLEHLERIKNEMNTLFAKTEVLIYIAGLGGGTGTGALPVILSQEVPAPTRIVLVTVPDELGGIDERANAVTGLRNIWDLTQTLNIPIVIIDNAKIAEELAAQKTTLEDANREIIGPILALLKIAGEETELNTFDSHDFANTIDQGGRLLISQSTRNPDDVKDEHAMAKWIRDSWEYCYPAQFDPASAEALATIIRLPKNRLKLRGALQSALTSVAVIFPEAKQFSGVYLHEGTESYVELITVLSGMGMPLQRWKALKETLKTNQQARAEKKARKAKEEEELWAEEGDFDTQSKIGVPRTPRWKPAMMEKPADTPDNQSNSGVVDIVAEAQRRARNAGLRV